MGIEQLQDSRPSVLILAYGWPPDPWIGAVRPVYLSNQLAKRGWHPIVITVREEYHDLQNTEGIVGDDSALVIRTRYLRNPRHVYVRLKKIVTEKIRFGGHGSKAEDAKFYDLRPSDPATVPRSLKDNFVSLLYIPDEFLGWFPFALNACLRTVRQFRPVCVITTGPPHTSHLVGLGVKRLCRIPWIVDLRDPWAWHDGQEDVPQLWSDQINSRLEANVIRRADRVVCVAPEVTKAYAAKYPAEPDNKWETISNGFNLDEFSSLGEIERADRFTISYVGALSFQRSPVLLLQAVAALISEGVVNPQRIAIRFVGLCDYVDDRSMLSIIAEHGLNHVVTVVPQVPRPQALRELLRSHVLLLLAGSQKMSISAKLYEYLAADRPILAISKEGAAAAIIKELRAGIVVGPDDLKGAKKAILYWYKEYEAADGGKPGYGTGLKNATLEFSWERLGDRYAGLITDCIGKI
jgi:glycosyltransferase involved in cell wall biosynthesis